MGYVPIDAIGQGRARFEKACTMHIVSHQHDQEYHTTMQDWSMTSVYSSDSHAPRFCLLCALCHAHHTLACNSHSLNKTPPSPPSPPRLLVCCCFVAFTGVPNVCKNTDGILAVRRFCISCSCSVNVLFVVVGTLQAHVRRDLPPVNEVRTYNGIVEKTSFRGKSRRFVGMDGFDYPLHYGHYAMHPILHRHSNSGQHGQVTNRSSSLC